MNILRRPPVTAGWNVRLARSRRAALERWIESAIDALDRIDGEADAEDDGSDEASAQPLALRGGADVLAA